MVKISAVIITQNEERNIGRCLESLKEVADEVIVVDSGSTDGTEAICRSFNSQFSIINFQFHQWEGYSGQKNYANSLATCPWILSIDADEALSPTLRESILTLKRQGFDSKAIYAVNRLNNYCGHWIRHCGWYPDQKFRLWNKGAVEWEGEVHEELRFLHTHPKTQLLEGDLLHYSYYTVAEHVQRMVKYAPMSAEKDYQQGRRCGWADVAFRPLWTFLRGYVFKGGFLDGVAGFVVCRLSASYTLVKYATLYNITHENSH